MLAKIFLMEAGVEGGLGMRVLLRVVSVLLVQTVHSVFV